MFRKSYQSKVKLLSDFILFKNDHKSQVKLIYSILTAIAVAELNYIMFDLPLALLMTITLVVHEIGHYIYAKASTAQPSYPLFIPIPFFLIGITHILNIPNKYLSIISLAGIFLSTLYLSFVFLFNLLIPIYNPIVLIMSIIISIVFNLFGKDGKTYRKAKQNLV